jgi:hypothetical protein
MITVWYPSSGLLLLTTEKDLGLGQANALCKNNENSRSMVWFGTIM